MYLILTAISGPHTGKVLNLQSDGSTRVGRGENTDFSFPEDLSMSTNHFLIEGRPTCGLLTDLQSTNGTFVNGEPVSEAIVSNGDEIYAGETAFAVSLSASSFLAHMVTLVPSWDNPNAMAFPMPWLDPVTIATRPVSPSSILFLTPLRLTLH